MAARYRAGVIGRTGRGGYGHGLDRVYLGMDEIDIIAVADDDGEGLTDAGKRLGVVNLYSDYREMLKNERLDIVSVCPRWLSQHTEMVLAVAEAKACVFLEKPIAPTLAEADIMISACDEAGVTLGIAHQGRVIETARYARSLINDGAIGDIVSAQMRGKEDSRGGGEDLMVLGTHTMDLLRYLVGRNPIWVFASVTTQDGRAIQQTDAAEGPEELGLISGDKIHALFGFGNGITSTFESRRHQEGNDRFGLQIYGTRGIMSVYNLSQEISIYEAPFWRPDRTVLVRDVAQEARDRLPGSSDFQSPQMEGNAIIVRDILQAQDQGRRPVSSGHDGRWALEMIHGIYASHLLGCRVSLPLENRDHPLADSD